MELQLELGRQAGWQAVGTKDGGGGSTHLHVANHVAPQDGCQLVTVVFVVQPDLAVRRQGLQGRVCGPQHGEGPMRGILKQGQEAGHLARISRGVAVRDQGAEVGGWTTETRKGLLLPAVLFCSHPRQNTDVQAGINLHTWTFSAMWAHKSTLCAHTGRLIYTDSLCTHKG